MTTDSKLLLNVATGNRSTTKARLTVDIAAVREPYDHGTIKNIALRDQAYNVGNPLKKSCTARFLNSAWSPEILNFRSDNMYNILNWTYPSYKTELWSRMLQIIYQLIMIVHHNSANYSYTWILQILKTPRGVHYFCSLIV